MNHATLQMLMRKMGHYDGELDGQFGPVSRAAVIRMLSSTSPVALTDQDYKESAARLGVEPAAIKAVVAVESGKAGFQGNLPVILPEPHIFSRLTGRRFDSTHPNLSWPTWDKTKYPKTQADRWEQLSRLIALDVDAGFACPSYGRFQIVGMNYKLCGFSDSFEHALAHSHDEESQLLAFENFVRNTGLVDELRNKDWAGFAKGYNGAAYAKNQYHTKLAKAYAAAS